MHHPKVMSVMEAPDPNQELRKSDDGRGEGVKPLAVIYEFDTEDDIRGKVEGLGYRVLRVYRERSEIVRLRGKYPELSRLLTDIHNGRISADAVFIPSIKTFGSLDLYLFVRKVLTMNGVELRSLKKREGGDPREGPEEALKGIRSNLIVSALLYSAMWVAGIYLSWSTMDPVIMILVGTSLVVAGAFFVKKVLNVRRHVLRKISELKKVEELRGRRIRFVVKSTGVEVIETAVI